MAIRFNLVRKLRDLEEAQGRPIPWKEVSEATGISPSVLSSLASPRSCVTTNTRFVEALCRYFRCPPGELLELVPSLEDEPRCHVGQLYPNTGVPGSGRPD